VVLEDEYAHELGETEVSNYLRALSGVRSQERYFGLTQWSGASEHVRWYHKLTYVVNPCRQFNGIDLSSVKSQLRGYGNGNLSGARLMPGRIRISLLHGGCYGAHDRLCKCGPNLDY